MKQGSREKKSEGFWDEVLKKQMWHKERKRSEKLVNKREVVVRIQYTKKKRMERSFLKWSVQWERMGEEENRVVKRMFRASIKSNRGRELTDMKEVLFGEDKEVERGVVHETD